jgi:hypothetical protein
VCRIRVDQRHRLLLSYPNLDAPAHDLGHSELQFTNQCCVTLHPTSFTVLAEKLWGLDQGSAAKVVLRYSTDVASCHALFAERLKEGPEHAIRQHICGFRSIGHGSIFNASDNRTTLRTIHHGNVVHAPIASNGRIARHRFGVRTTGRQDFALDNRPTVHRSKDWKSAMPGNNVGIAPRRLPCLQLLYHNRDIDYLLVAID